jgi:hypothetical protein
MKESSLYAEIGNERAQEYVLAALEERFDAQVAAACREAVQGVTKEDKLRRLHRLAIRCASVEAFQQGLRSMVTR